MLFSFATVELARGDSTPIEDIAQQDVVKSRSTGESIGALGGALVDQYYGQKHHLPPQMFQRILGSSGATIGTQVGRKLAERRRAYATEYDFLRSETASTEKAIATKEDQIAAFRKKHNEIDSEIDHLKDEERHNHDVTIDAGKLLDRVNGQIEADRQLMTKYSNGILYLAEAIRTSKEAANQTAELERERNQLSAKRTSLLRQYEDINHLDRAFRASRERLIGLAKAGNSSSVAPSASQSNGLPDLQDVIKRNVPFPGL